MKASSGWKCAVHEEEDSGEMVAWTCASCCDSYHEMTYGKSVCPTSPDSRDAERVISLLRENVSAVWIVMCNVLRHARIYISDNRVRALLVRHISRVIPRDIGTAAAPHRVLSTASCIHPGGWWLAVCSNRVLSVWASSVISLHSSSWKHVATQEELSVIIDNSSNDTGVANVVLSVCTSLPHLLSTDGPAVSSLRRWMNMSQSSYSLSSVISQLVQLHPSWLRDVDVSPLLSIRANYEGTGKKWVEGVEGLGELSESGSGELGSRVLGVVGEVLGSGKEWVVGRLLDGVVRAGGTWLERTGLGEVDERWMECVLSSPRYVSVLRRVLKGNVRRRMDSDECGGMWRYISMCSNTREESCGHWSDVASAVLDSLKPVCFQVSDEKLSTFKDCFRTLGDVVRHLPENELAWALVFPSICSSLATQRLSTYSSQMDCGVLDVMNYAKREGAGSHSAIRAVSRVIDVCASPYFMDRTSVAVLWSFCSTSVQRFCSLIGERTYEEGKMSVETMGKLIDVCYSKGWSVLSGIEKPHGVETPESLLNMMKEVVERVESHIRGKCSEWMRMWEGCGTVGKSNVVISVERNVKKVGIIPPRKMRKKKSMDFIELRSKEEHERERLRERNDLLKYERDVFVNNVLSIDPSCIDESSVHLDKVRSRFPSWMEYVTVFKNHIQRESVCGVQSSTKGVHKDWMDCYVHVENDRNDDSCAVLSLNSYHMDVYPVWRINDVLLLELLDGRQGCRFFCRVRKRRAGLRRGNVRVQLGEFRPSLDCTGGRMRWRGRKVENLSTSIREFQAVHLMKLEIHEPTLYNVILDPYEMKFLSDNSQTVKRPSKPISHDLRHFLKDNLNDKQRVAVGRTLKTPTGFVLIQGPPGTGKTKTVLALMSCLLSQSSDRILLSCPSNAAVDEIILRVLRGGLIGADGSVLEVSRDISVVRTGVRDNVDRNVLSTVFLDTLVEREVSDFMSSRYPSLHSDKLRDVENKLERIDEDLSTSHVHDVHEEEHDLRSRRRYLQAVIKTVVDQKENFQSRILSRAQLVCTTLSGAAWDELGEFDTCIVDEASQAKESECLIPITFRRVRRMVMVGDPYQLPPLVLSEEVQLQRGGLSLMDRLFRVTKSMPGMTPASYNKFIRVMLNVQYRMHPIIREFSGRNVYDDMLRDGENVLRMEYSRQHHRCGLGPLRFFDTSQCTDGMEKRETAGTSISNTPEAIFVSSIVDYLLAVDITLNCNGIGVITPYSEQCRYLRSRLPRDVEVHTVDGFQGREKQVIIFSAVRSNARGQIGFLRDWKRLNVSLTRSKYTLIVVANGRTLEESNSKLWKALLNFCKENEFHTLLPPRALSDAREILQETCGEIKAWNRKESNDRDRKRRRKWL